MQRSSKKFPINIISLFGLWVVVGAILAACGGGPTPTTEILDVTESPTATVTPFEIEAPSATEAPEVTETPQENEGLSGTITLWHSWREKEIESLVEVIAAFQVDNPNIQFDVLYTPLDELRGKFEMAATAGGGPTILLGSADWGQAFYDAGLVADVSHYASEEFLDTINAAALGTVRSQGALTGLPQTIQGVVMYRNPSIIPEAPETFEDLLEAAQEASSGDVLGSYLEYGSFYSGAHLNGLGGKMINEDGDPLFNSPEGVEWMNLFLQAREAGIPGEVNTENDVNLFKSGKAGMIIEGSWRLAELVGVVGPENLVIDPWPTPLSGYIQTERIYLSTNAGGESAAHGWAFIEFLLSPEAQAILADPTKAARLPVVEGVELTDPYQRQLIEALAGGTELPVIPEMNAYWIPLDNAIKSVLERGIDPSAALATAEEEVNAALAGMRDDN